MTITSLGTQRCTGLVTPAVHPPTIFTGKLTFRCKSQPTQLGISKPSKEHSSGSPEVLNQNLRQIGPGVPEL